MQNVPELNFRIETFYASAFKILKVLNLLFQDLKLNLLNIGLVEDLGYFLFWFARSLDFAFSNNYCDYYLRENPNLLKRFFNDLELNDLDKILH